MEKSGFLKYFNQVLQSKYLACFSVLFGFLCWTLGLSTLVVCVEAFIFTVVLLFSKDVKNIYAPFFFVSFFIPDIRTMTNYTAYYIVVGIALATMIGVFIFRCVKDRKTITFGKFWIGFLASSVAFLLGGIINAFDIITTLMILGFLAGMFILYFMAVNYTKNLAEYLEDILLIGGLIVGIEILVFYLTKPDDLTGFFSAQGVNTGALILVLAIVASFSKALKSKRDYIYFIIVIVLTAFIVFSKCRAGMMLTALVDVGFSIYLFIKSKNKKPLFIILGVLIVSMTLVLIFSEAVRTAIDSLVFSKEGVSGRDELWAECLEMFKVEPIFGYGFYSFEGLPHLREGSKVILTHNTVVQWLTCLGVVGALIMLVYYFYKYRILFTGFNIRKLFAIACVISLELSGMVDQAANMDVFIVTLSIILVASVEKLDKNIIAKQLQD